MRSAREAVVALLVELFSPRELAQLLQSPPQDARALIAHLRDQGPIPAALLEAALEARPDRRADLLAARRLLHQRPIPKLTAFHEVNLDGIHATIERKLEAAALQCRSRWPTRQQEAWRALAEAYGLLALLGKNARPDLRDRTLQLLQELTEHRIHRRRPRLPAPTPRGLVAAALGVAFVGALLSAGRLQQSTARLSQQLRTAESASRLHAEENAALRAQLVDLEATQNLLRSQQQDANDCAAAQDSCSRQLRACQAAGEQLGPQLRAWAQMKDRITASYEDSCAQQPNPAACRATIAGDLERLDATVCLRLSAGSRLPEYAAFSSSAPIDAYRIPQGDTLAVPRHVLVFPTP